VAQLAYLCIDCGYLSFPSRVRANSCVAWNALTTEKSPATKVTVIISAPNGNCLKRKIERLNGGDIVATGTLSERLALWQDPMYELKYRSLV
jgi:predicted ATP-dependent serine protease